MVKTLQTQRISVTILEILNDRMCLQSEAFNESSLQSEIKFVFSAVRKVSAKDHAPSSSFIALSLGCLLGKYIIPATEHSGECKLLL